MSTIRLFAVSFVVAALAGCASSPRQSQAAAPAAADAAEQRIVLNPWLVSGEYFRQRPAAPAAFDAQEIKRSREDVQARQAAVEERLARLENAGLQPTPSPQGYVVRVQGRELFTDLGSREAGLAPGSSLAVLREHELVHPVSGLVLGKTWEEVARAKVVEVARDFSRAEIVEIRSGETVKPKDRVALRKPRAE